MDNDVKALGELSPQLQDAAKKLMNDVFITLINRQGGQLEIPIAEIDGAGRYWVSMEVRKEKGTINFKVNQKA